MHWKTVNAVERMLSAFDWESYEIGCLIKGQMMLRTVSPQGVMKMLPFLAQRNSAGAHVYIRPYGGDTQHSDKEPRGHRFTLLDDLTEEQIDAMSTSGFQPAAVIETSPRNFQAWLKHAQTFPPRLSTLAATILANKFKADRSSADWRHFGRLPGFTNRKPKYQTGQGHFPFVTLHQTRSMPFDSAEQFHRELSRESEAENERRRMASCRKSQAVSQSKQMPLTYFRDLPKFRDQPARADMAFAVFSLVAGIREEDIIAELDGNYLSRNQNARRKREYINRTINKAARFLTKA